MKTNNYVKFPRFSGIRCLMMPYLQGHIESVPEEYSNGYEDFIENNYLEKDEIGFLTIDESEVKAGKPHRGDRAKFGRALHTEGGKNPDLVLCSWGGGGCSWGRSRAVLLEMDTEVLLVNNLDDSCAIWDVTHENTSLDGDIGDFADEYPYAQADMMKAGEVHRIGILTPHESLPVKRDFNRQFLRIVGKGVHGREKHFTVNPLVSFA